MNFADLGPFVKAFLNISCVHNYPYPCIVRVHENSPCEIFMLVVFTKVSPSCNTLIHGILPNLLGFLLLLFAFLVFAKDDNGHDKEANVS